MLWQLKLQPRGHAHVQDSLAGHSGHDQMEIVRQLQGLGHLETRLDAGNEW